MGASLKRIKQETGLRFDILSKATTKAFRACASTPLFSRQDWYLAGGTALALFGGKISLISYPFFKPAHPMVTFGNVSLLAPPDIAVMKIIAISQRGRKRDFFDLFWLCQNALSLNDIIVNVNSKYTVRQKPAHILKSLVYFDDAENDPDPVIFFEADWHKVKTFFQKEIQMLTKKLIQLN